VKVKVLFIVGEGRSGSTLLEKALASSPGVFGAGELIHVWERGFLDNQLCACGEPFKSCSLWRQVSDELKDASPKQALKALRRVRLRYFWRKPSEDELWLRELHYRLYATLKRLTGARLIIDSSKHPVYARLMASHPLVEPLVLHLVRDPRGVAYSWSKKKRRPEITAHEAYMPRYSPLRSALSWLVVNALSEQLARRLPYLRVRYEDFVKRPKDTLERIGRFVGLEGLGAVAGDGHLELKKTHQVAGNPSRFKEGRVELKPDEAWKESMPPLSKLIVSLLTHPLRKRYYG